MKQIVQNVRKGTLELVEVPAPVPDRGQVLVRNAFSVLSPGTEKLALDFARKSLLGKARSRPDLVRQVLRKLRQEGPGPTIQTVTNRLDAPQPLGYASAGIVEAVGEGVTSIQPGDRVACAGAGYANHAEYVVVPENLTAHVSDSLSLDRAAFATLGAIAMQGVRIGDSRLGEVVAVVGLGLIGQLTVQLLLAGGCRVYGIDLDSRQVERSRALGMDWGGSPKDDHELVLAEATGGHGVDVAIVTASSESSAPISTAASLCRHRGAVVAVGATAMDLDRRVFYEKELELRMSMSYGPGRYDRRYEEEGLDYPVAYVRWTEQRNLQAFLDLAAKGSIDPLEMDVETVDFAESTTVYESLAAGRRSSLAAVFRYPAAEADRTAHDGATLDPDHRASKGPERVGVAFIGAGNYAKSVLLPALEVDDRIDRRTIVTATGPSATRTCERYGFGRSGTRAEDVLGDPDVDLVFVTTRHDSHASLATRALESGTNVWLEKPMGLSHEEVDQVAEAARASNRLLMVGFNRRFSTHARAAKRHLEGRRTPLSIHYRVCAGPMPVDTWIVDPLVGGGRIVGEVCHFIDLCTYLVGRNPSEVMASSIARDASLDDSTTLTLTYPDRSVATIAYLANASPELAKEHWEAHASQRSVVCDNFRSTWLSGGRKVRGLNQDKGQRTAVGETIDAVRSGATAVIPLDEIIGTSRASLAAIESLRSGRPVRLDDASS